MNQTFNYDGIRYFFLAPLHGNGLVIVLPIRCSRTTCAIAWQNSVKFPMYTRGLVAKNSESCLHTFVREVEIVRKTRTVTSFNDSLSQMK